MTAEKTLASGSIASQKLQTLTSNSGIVAAHAQFLMTLTQNAMANYFKPDVSSTDRKNSPTPANLILESLIAATRNLLYSENSKLIGIYANSLTTAPSTSDLVSKTNAAATQIMNNATTAAADVKAATAKGDEAKKDDPDNAPQIDQVTNAANTAVTTKQAVDNASATVDVQIQVCIGS